MNRRKAYSSDLTDGQWKKVRPLIPKALPGGHPRTVDMREVLNAIFYREKSGCAWQDLPHDFPPHQSVYEYYRAWSLDGTWERIHNALRDKVRRQAGRNIQPSAAILDSQSVKTAEKRGFVTAGTLLNV